MNDRLDAPAQHLTSGLPIGVVSAGAGISAKSVSVIGNQRAANARKAKWGLLGAAAVAVIGFVAWWISRDDERVHRVAAAPMVYEEGTFPEIAAVRALNEGPSNRLLEPTLLAIRRATLSFDEGETSPAVDLGRAERWEVRFPPGGTAEMYARQLDDFGIELGILGGSAQIGYLSKLSQAEPARRVAPAAEEKRLYMTWRDGALREVDRALLKRIGVNLQGKILAHFYPEKVETELARLERQFSEPRTTREIRRTVFTVRPAANGFSFMVGEQQYLDGDVKRPSASDALVQSPAAEANGQSRDQAAGPLKAGQTGGSEQLPQSPASAPTDSDKFKPTRPIEGEGSSPENLSR